MEQDKLLAKILQNIEMGTQSADDIEQLRRVLQYGTGKTIEQLGQYNVVIEKGKDIQIGHRFYQHWDAEAVRMLVDTIQQQDREKRDRFIPLLPKQFPQQDYSRLQNFLAASRWRDANEMTRTLILKVGGGEKDGYVSQEQIQNFPDDVLKVIDDLWLEKSGGKFGLSVQKQIFDRCKNNPQKFGDRVGWRVGDRWISSSEIITDCDRAPEGHLPWGIVDVPTMDNAALDAFVNGLRFATKAIVKQDWQKQLLADFMSLGGLSDKEEFKRSIEYELSHDEPWWKGSRLQELKVLRLFSLLSECDRL
ncbi:GUN4 domain-containing protein [Roseofilum casamattae]|uniref:GUN4 domain-containing protein n=1 Tax=Roseofilum casamattae BLCC-M143 TaxID=3022442 RepID=A0ABT7C2K3_9CYAN|nr:GUN4 domain-containing protein [Roseofilum casamattae]MDJ1185664.1 GUN4 domain-containing protein [Roseofilum casamattae BLCC-M143]